MPNMSYCRFENTARDLRDCLDTIRNGEIDELNSYELDGLIKIQEMSQDIVDEKEYIDEIIEESKQN